MRTTVWVTFQLEGFHHWPGAPEEHGYLAHPHRHVFHFKAYATVSHNDRAVEFIWLKRQLRAKLAPLVGTQEAPVSKSCEMLCHDVRDACAAIGVTCVRAEVSEDGENGAEVVFE